jgi:hypothetical protein
VLTVRSQELESQPGWDAWPPVPKADITGGLHGSSMVLGLGLDLLSRCPQGEDSPAPTTYHNPLLTTWGSDWKVLSFSYHCVQSIGLAIHPSMSRYPEPVGGEGLGRLPLTPGSMAHQHGPH